MKARWGTAIFWISAAVFLAACSSATGNPVVPDSTDPATQTPVPTATATSLPARNPASPTRTPLPTIPTFTATFDVRTIVAVTPAPKAECPTVHYEESIDKIAYGDVAGLLAAMNRGISFATIAQAIDRGLAERFTRFRSVASETAQVDLNRDGIPELILPFGGATVDHYVLGCKSGEYTILYAIMDAFEFPSYRVVPDANHNGLPEVLFTWSHCSEGGCAGQLVVVEWHGQGLQVVLDESGLNTFEREIWIKDLNDDGPAEFGWDGGIPIPGFWDYEVWGPWRIERHAYRWDGVKFAPLTTQYEPAKFRFQAAQDGDVESLTGQDERTMNSYSQVIFDDQLGWWSKERFLYQHDLALSSDNGSATPTFIPKDLTEYPRLAAYAYYRMIILHVHLGEMDAARVKYDTQQKKFPAGDPGHPYVEMATGFWNAYQSTSSMYEGCAAAIEYAAEHPEILVPLGSDYHGGQSHTYVPSEVCPFR